VCIVRPARGKLNQETYNFDVGVTRPDNRYPQNFTMTRFQSSKEDVAYSIGGMSRFEDSPCFLVALDNWDISLIISSLRYAHWQRRWLDLGDKSWDEVEAKVDNLERCLMSGCNVDTLVEVLQNALYYDDKGLAQILVEGQSAGQEGSVTLAEVLTNFEGDDIIQYPAVYGVLQVLADILPPDFVENYKIVDPPQFALNIVSELVKAIIGVVDTAFNGVSATANTGEVVSDAADTAISGLDTIFSGMTAGALSLSAILDLIGLFKSGQTPPADDNPALHTQVRVLNDVFVTQGAISCAPDVNVNCGGGCGGQPMTDVGTDVTDFNDGGEVEQPDPEGDPPDRFDTWEDYYNYKCSAANWLYDQYTGTLRNWGSFVGITGIISAALVIGLMLLTVPPIGLAVICAAIGALAATDISIFALFVAIADGLDAQKQDLVCDLYNATTTTEAVSSLTDATDTIIDGLETTEGLKTRFREACNNLLSNNNTKSLFEYDANVAGYEGSVECGVCEDEIIEFIAGEIISKVGNVYTVASTDRANFPCVMFNFKDTNNRNCEISCNTSISMPGTYKAFNGYVYPAGGTELIYNSDDPPTEEQCSWYWQIYNDAVWPLGQFTITLTVEQTFC